MIQSQWYARLVAKDVSCTMENTNKKGHGCLRDILAARQGFIVLGKNPGLFVLGEPTHDRQVPETGGSTC